MKGFGETRDLHMLRIQNDEATFEIKYLASPFLSLSPKENPAPVSRRHAQTYSW